MRFIPYARQSIDSKDIKAVIDVLKGDYITQGPKIGEFERRVAEYCGARYAVALNSGTSALHAACFAAGIKKGDEVIASPISFAASSNCILYCGGRPVFADVLEDTLTIDPCEIEKAITRKTRAVIPVDFAGHPAELQDIKRIASKRGLIVIEDAAHALGAEYKGRKIGCGIYSDMTILSFHAVKHITTGEGGMVLTDRKDLYDKIVMFRSHGITRENYKFEIQNPNSKNSWYYEMQELGFNYRITDIQCALGLSQMRRLDDFITRRREIARFYKKDFEDMKGVTCLGEREYASPSWHIFPIRVKKERDKIFDNMRAEGIGVNLHYMPIYLHPYYRRLSYKKGLCPKAEGYYREAVTLPLYAGMTNPQVRKVIKVVKKVVACL